MTQYRNRVIATLLFSAFILAVCAHTQERKVPSSAGEWNVVGMGLALQDRWPEAAEAFRKAVKLEPTFVAAHNNLGFTLATLGKSTEAIKAFQLAIKVKPDDPSAYYNLGFTYEAMGKWQEAANVFQQALERSPRWDLATYHLGFSDLNLGLWKESAEAFQQYLNPPTTVTSTSSGEAGRAKSKSADPIQEGVLVFNIEPEKYIALANLAFAYQKQGKYADAIAAYRQSLQLKQDFADGHYSLAESYLLSGNREAALKELETLQKLNQELAGKLRALIDKSK